MPEKMERIPIKKFESPSLGELVEVDDLNGEEKSAVLDAIAECRKSTNPEFRAGATAVAMDGTKVALHNDTPNEQGKGQKGHAEMRALMALYRTVNPAERKLKFLALAASASYEDVINVSEKYGPEVKNLDDMKMEPICGHCLKFIADYTGNFISSETGERDPNARDIPLLIVVASGQVFKSSLRKLLPAMHRPRNVSIEPLMQHIDKSPGDYGGK